MLKQLIILIMMFYMERTEIKVLNNVKEDAIKNYELFKWKLVEQKPDLKETTLVFERDNEVSYYQELVNLEEKFNKVYTIPSWLFYVFIGITLGYVSVMAILWLTKVINIEKGYFVIILAIPSGILLLLNVFFTYLRNKEMDNHINKKDEKYRIYQEKVDKLVK